MFRLLVLFLRSFPQLFCYRRDLVLENLLLRQQFAVLKARHPKPTLRSPDKLIWAIARILDCLKKYEGNERPPSHRVPDSYYRREEPCLGVFVTTAFFAETASECVEASSITLASGLRLS